MKKTHILATLLALLTLAGCEKVDDGVDGMVEIFAESMSGGKVLLDGANSTWVSGDQIRLNGTTATVTRRDDRAYISSDGLADVNRAVYPASLVGSDLTSNTVSIEFPRYYHYRTDSSGHQVLDLPMAAYSNNNTSPLQFKHLTGALYITITNTASVPLTLQSVTVVSRTCMLSGSRSFDISNIENILPVNISNEEKQSVSMLFDTGYTLAANESLRVMLPILPVDSANRFALKVKSYKQGEQKSYLLEKWQPAGGNHSLARNVLGYAPIDIKASGTRTTLLEINNGGEYEVRTPLDFELMTKAIDNQWYAYTHNAKYNIMDDIDMTGRSVNTILYNSFDGTIEGNGHTISNLTIRGRLNGSEYYCGLFQNNAYTIQNIVLSNVHLECQNVGNNPLYVGILGAKPNHDGTIMVNNCSFSIGSFNRGENTGQVFWGGLVGYGESGAINISNCQAAILSNIDISGTDVYCGGLIGSMGSGDAIIDGTTWNGELSVNAVNGVYLGGLIGQKSMGRITATNCNISGSAAVTTGESCSSRWIGQVAGSYNNQGSAILDGTTANISFTLNNEAITPSNFGINR